MIKKIIFINGAPGSGKDTLATILDDSIWCRRETTTTDITSAIFMFKDPLVSAVRSLFSISEDDWIERYDDRELKEVPWDKLNGMSQREALIWMSEEIAKEKFGRDFFGKAMVNRLTSDLIDNDLVIFIPDSGFLEETKAVVDRFGKDKCVMINTLRDGYTFDNDSRSLVTADDLGIEGTMISNNGTVEDLEDMARGILSTYVYKD